MTDLVRRVIVAAIFGLSVPSMVALADGYGLGVYHYVYPPTKMLKLVNIQPTGKISSVRIGASFTYVATSDAQVTIQINDKGSFGFPKGQRRVQVAIHPLRHYTLPTGSDKLDGNVYALSFKYLPSGRPIQTAKKQVLITLDAPHNTPSNEFLGLYGHSWKPVCPEATILSVGGLPSCLTKALPRQVAIFYRPNSHFGHPSSKSGTSLSETAIELIAAAAIAAGILLFAAFVAVRRRRG